MISDLMLEPAQEYLVAISYEIRKQIMLEICKRVQKFSNIYENYVQNEMEIYEFQKEQGEGVNAEMVDEEEMFLNQYSFDDKLYRPLQNPQPEKLPESLPYWLEMEDLLKKTDEEEYLEEYVILAGIAIKKESFLPLPPKSPKTPVESPKASQIAIEDICIE